LQDRLDRVLWELRQPLDMTRVKRRQAPGQGTVPYLEGYDVIDRANAIFDFAWSFDLLGEPVVVRWQKKIMVWNQQERRKVPQMDANGNFQVEDVGIVYATGKVSITLKGTVYSHADLGRCVFSGDTPEALDMALAGSVTDCLKRCFRQLGDQFGNTLYDKELLEHPIIVPRMDLHRLRLLACTWMARVSTAMRPSRKLTTLTSRRWVNSRLPRPTCGTGFPPTASQLLHKLEVKERKTKCFKR
jgi:recombination DNA repair RAD52 pathway protein